MAPRVIVIGAGWSGLAAAKTYLQVNPAIELTVLDDDYSVGGVWSSARLYRGLMANSPNGLYEYSDLSMVNDSQPALKPIPGKQVQAYLHEYAEKNGFLSKIKFSSKVLYSKPHWPDIPRDEDFAGTVIHSKLLGQEHQKLAESEKVADVVIVGGCKSAVEAANIFLAAGKRVHWVVRESQQGVPFIVVDPDMRPNLLAVNNTRLFNIWSPSIFATTGFCPTRLVRGGMQLSSGQVVKADAVVYATGWRSSIDFFDEGEAAQLGIPIPLTRQDVEVEKFWDQLESKADMLVTSVLPRLAQCPRPVMEKETGTTPFRMYRQVLSPRLFAQQDRSVAFAGYVSNSQTSICSEILALWVVAWMEDMMPAPLPTEAEMEADVATVNAWMARRYGTRGRRDPEIVLEVQTFLDQLMEDLSLRVQRKNRGVFGPIIEWVTPYEPSDYKGMIEEFLAKAKPVS